jgi:hypothetical protein
VQDQFGKCNILCDVAEILDLWFQAPVPLILCQKLVLVEKPALPSVLEE